MEESPVSVAKPSLGSCVRNGSDNTNQERLHAERKLFQNAKKYLGLGPVFRFVTYLYAERKLVVFFGVHLMSTLVIWAHFALIKFQEQKNAVPDGAPFYWLKRTVPPLEFGSMHAILFQMALIPLTMSRFCIASVLSNSPTVNLFVPVDRAVRIHIHLGYTMVTVVFLAVLLFISFFGIVCLAGDDDSFCDKFTSEIMITGYVLLAMILLIGGTSYFRHAKKVPYELFYAVHHLVFILYILTIVHTFDRVHRNNERKRSQSFAWFSATLLFYVCDRAAMNLLHQYRAPLVSSSRVQGSGKNNESRMVILKLLRPALFDFRPGQYALLRMKDVDSHWHPFSIASEPSSDYLEFYIEVVGKSTSWTAKLWDVLERDAPAGEIQGESYTRFELDIMGPYGTSLANMEDFSHALAMGTGTGIVPALSLFKQHIRQLMLLDPTRHFAALREHEQKVRKVESAQLPRKGSLAQHALSVWCCSSACKQRERQIHDLHHDPESAPRSVELREKIRSKLVASTTENETKVEQGPSPTSTGSLNHSHPPPNVRGRSDMELKRAAFEATRSLYGVVALSILPVLGVALLGWTISWNTLRFDLPSNMTNYLTAFTIVFQACFAAVAVFVWDAYNFLALVDVALLLVTPFADWFWVNKYKANGVLCAREIALYCLLTGYMTFRSWAMTIRPRYRSWSRGIHSNQCGGAAACLERFELIWSTRSSSLVAKIAPDIVQLWDDLVRAWGEENARRACKITVHVTDKDRTAVALLQRELAHTSLYRDGCIQFERPNFTRIIENQTLARIRGGQRYSYSLLAFCGAPELSQLVHQIKISNDMVTAITGNKHHQVEFVSEHYGGLKKRVTKTQKQPQHPVSPDDVEEVPAVAEGDNEAALPVEYSLGEGRKSNHSKHDSAVNKSCERDEVVMSRLTTRKDTHYVRTPGTKENDVERLSVCTVEPMTGDEQWWEGVAGISE